jgi:DNA-binding HxlR family transcriptional regulator
VRDVPSKRSYDDGCGVAHALDLIGERWALLIVRDLLLGPKRFTDLQVGLPGAGPNALTQRLRDLQRVGVIQRRTLAPPAGAKVYELTDWGRELEPTVRALGRWGTRSPVVPRQGDVRADSLMLWVREAFASPGPAWTAVHEIRLGRDSFTARVAAGQLIEVVRGQYHGSPDTIVDTDAPTFDQMMNGELTAGEAMRSGRLTVVGDAEAADRFLSAVLP